MSAATDLPDQPRDQANDLYWNSGETVDGLAARLGMSRKAMYAAVRPLPIGVACEECGTEMVFTNRSSRSAGSASCPSCGAEEKVEQAAPPATPRNGAEMLDEPASTGTTVVSVPPAQPGWRRLRDVAPERAAKIGGAAALGVAVGAAAVRAIRKRS